jgi:hypothetical protein
MEQRNKESEERERQAKEQLERERLALETWKVTRTDSATQTEQRTIGIIDGTYKDASTGCNEATFSQKQNRTEIARHNHQKDNQKLIKEHKICHSRCFFQSV